MNVNALEHSPFRVLPEDHYPYLFSFLDARSLARVAIICRLFKKVSEGNDLWKRLYASRWTIPQISGELLPRQWKCYYERRDVLSSENASPGQALLWSRGLHFTALQEKSKAIWLAAYYPLLDIASPATVTNGQADIKQVLAQILTRFFQNEQEAFTLYLQYQPELKMHARVIGTWLSMLFHASKTIKMLDAQKIFLPPHLNKADEHRSFLQGAAIACVERGKYTLALASLHCLVQMRFREADKTEEHDRFFSAFVIQGLREKSASLWEKMADILVDVPSHAGLALNVYCKTLQGATCPSIHAELRLAVKISRALIAARKHDSPISKEILAIPLRVFQKYILATRECFTPDVLTTFFEMAMLFEYEPFYQPLIKESKQEAYHKATTPEAGCFYSVKMKLCEKVKDFPEAVRAWVMLCQCLNSQSSDILTLEREEIFQRIYRLIDENPAVGDTLRNVQTNSKFAKVGIAYALYKNGEIDKALKTMIDLISFVARDEVAWIQRCSRSSFKAVLIYSLVMDSEDDLENYYMDMLDYFPQMSGYIYHNLAVRFYFQGCFEAAFKIIPLAEHEGFDEPELWIVKGLCYRAIDEIQQAQACFQKAHALDPAFHSARSFDNQHDLLLFEVEEGSQQVKP